MPYGEDITISVGDAVRIHPKYENHKFKKLKYGVTYFVKELHTDYTKKIRYLETEKGDTILLNMDQTYFEHAGKEEPMEEDEDFQPDYTLEVGDIVLIQNSGFGFIGKDKNKYVEVTGHGDYFGGEGVRVRAYDCQLETKSYGDNGVVGYGSFGKTPLILFNINDEHVVDEEHTVVAEGSKQEVDKALGIKRDMVHSPSHYSVFDGTEAIEIIASSLTQEEFRGYCFGNLLKYRLRCGKKDDVTQELNKADKYKELYEEYKYLCKG